MLLYYIPVLLVSGAGCGGFFKEDVGSLSSPQYPDNYSNADHCIWLIEARDGDVIELIIQGLQLERNDEGECVDFLEVRVHAIRLISCADN